MDFDHRFRYGLSLALFRAGFRFCQDLSAFLCPGDPHIAAGIARGASASGSVRACAFPQSLIKRAELSVLDNGFCKLRAVFRVHLPHGLRSISRGDRCLFLLGEKRIFLNIVASVAAALHIGAHQDGRGGCDLFEPAVGPDVDDPGIFTDPGDHEIFCAAEGIVQALFLRHLRTELLQPGIVRPAENAVHGIRVSVHLRVQEGIDEVVQLGVPAGGRHRVGVVDGLAGGLRSRTFPAAAVLRLGDRCRLRFLVLPEPLRHVRDQDDQDQKPRDQRKRVFLQELYNKIFVDSEDLSVFFVFHV